MPIKIPARRRLRQEECQEFKATLEHMARCCFKKILSKLSFIKHYSSHCHEATDFCGTFAAGFLVRVMKLLGS